MFWFFGLEACGIEAPRPGIKPVLPALDGKILTTGPPGKSLSGSYLLFLLMYTPNPYLQWGHISYP